MSEDKNFQSALDKAKELESFNFNSDEGFDVQGYYGALEQIAKKNENLKNEEAEAIVEEQAKTMIDPSFVEELNLKRKVVEDFIRKYDPNTKEVQDLELLDVDKLYAVSNYLLNSYIQHVNEARFIFSLTKAEYKFLNKTLLHEIGYNGDEVFNFAELYKNFWEGVQQKVEENKSLESYTFTVNIKMLLILHHLIKEHKVKGITNDFQQFQTVLFKIAGVNKLFNAYSIIIERIKSDRELWGNSLDEVMKVKDPEYMAQIAQQAKDAHEKSGSKNKLLPVTEADISEK